MGMGSMFREIFLTAILGLAFYLLTIYVVMPLIGVR